MEIIQPMMKDTVAPPEVPLKHSKPILGIVGGIGSGKSYVAQRFASLGRGVIVAGDPLGHEALDQPDIRATLAARWGMDRIVSHDGTINRKSIAQIIFHDPIEKQALENIVFPYIERRLQEEIAKGIANPEADLVLIDAAIMLETGWKDLCDQIVFVSCPREIRLQRVIEKRGWTESDLANREANQWPLERKQSVADYCIQNDGLHKPLDEQIGNVLTALNLTHRR
jgi:dephospho-CoA kinase